METLNNDICFHLEKMKKKKNKLINNNITRFIVSDVHRKDCIDVLYGNFNTTFRKLLIKTSLENQLFFHSNFFLSL